MDSDGAGQPAAGSPTATDGVIGLRSWDPADAHWYAASVRDPEIQRFTTESGSLTSDEVRAAIVALRADRRPGAREWLICDALNGERLGNIAVTVTDGVGEVSYWIAASARGRGAATRALRLVADHAFTALGARELRLWAHVDNVGSRTVAERVGFVRDQMRDRQREIKGSVWDMVAYTLTRHE